MYLSFHPNFNPQIRESRSSPERMLSPSVCSTADLLYLFFFASFLWISITSPLPPKFLFPTVFWISGPLIASKALCFQLITLSSVSSFYLFINKHSHAKKINTSVQHVTKSWDTGCLSMNLSLVFCFHHLCTTHFCHAKQVGIFQILSALCQLYLALCYPGMLSRPLPNWSAPTHYFET